MPRKQKVAIIGAGHNGLVCACYLQEAGFDVTVYERREIVGGLCVTEELFPGIKASSVAGFFGMLRQEIIEDLGLLERGLEPYFTNPTEIILLPGNRFLYTPRLDGPAKIEIGQVSQCELEGWTAFWREMSAASKLVYPYHLQTGVTQNAIEKMLESHGLTNIAEHIFKGSLLDLATKYFSHPSLMAAVSTCVVGFPDEIGSVYSCIHLGTARTLGEDGAWGLVKGGMGAVTQALLACALERGVKVHTSEAVSSIAFKDDQVAGVTLSDGTFHPFDLVVSNANPTTTFTKLVAPNMVPPQIREKIEGQEFTVSAGKIHFVLNGLPEIPILADLPNYHESTICLAIPLESVLEASRKARAGEMPNDLMITVLFNSVSDPSLCPPGKHLLSLAYHWLPSKIDGNEWNEQSNQRLLERTLQILQQHIPAIRDHIEQAIVISPGDLQRTYGAIDCWHLPMTSEYLIEKRRFGDKEYSTPFPGLFLCGAGTYPGGNVTGAPGRNCAMQIIESCVAPLQATGRRSSS
jgi:phytoene dehydrogenase-like protein